MGPMFPIANEEVRVALGFCAPWRWSGPQKGWLPTLVCAPERKGGFLKASDAAEQEHCNKPVLPGWSRGAAPC